MLAGPGATGTASTAIAVLVLEGGKWDFDFQVHSYIQHFPPSFL